MARLSTFFSPLIGLVVCTVGCSRQDEIRHYTVPKQAEVDRLAGGSDEPAGPKRMLAAIVLRPSQAWFFKLLGPETIVDTRSDEFNNFLKSLHFESDGAPQWSLPAGWTERPGDQMRYATLSIDGTPLEVTVTTLSRGDSDDAEYVLNNVNRWRGQLGLASLAPNELAGETKQVELNGAPATLVDLVGVAQAGSMSPPFAGSSGRSSSPAADRDGTSAGSKLKYDVPEGWHEEPATGFRKASFRLSDGGESGEVLVSDLDASAGDLLPNINRWRGMIGLEPTTQLDVDQHVESIGVGRHEGRYIEMIGEDKATFAVICQAAGRAWFIKMSGDRGLVERQRDHFKGFVHSLTIGEAAGAKDGN
ncbi:MAG TPA: hypothetical protein VHC22_11610 [Pirellulales bacterium]|nr:hypothetical protein [Pirellulales bacterium]